MNAPPDIDKAPAARAQASAMGSRTLEVFAATPQLNAWLFSKLASSIRGEVLEIGSGIGNLSRLIVERSARLTVSDTEPHYLDALRDAFADDARVIVTAFDLDDAPPPALAERRFDTIVAVNVIEHIRDDQALIGRLAQLLAPGGALVVYVPAGPFAYGSLDRELGHFRRYTRASLRALLAGAGLVTEPPAYMNLAGLLGWTVNGRLLRRRQVSPSQLAVFERLMPLLRLEDRLPARLPIGLGVYAAARKPAG